jgi:hypothetical protein
MTLTYFRARPVCKSTLVTLKKAMKPPCQPGGNVGMPAYAWDTDLTTT